MAKINLKNMNTNLLMSFIKENRLNITTKDRRLQGNRVVEKIKIAVNREEDIDQILNLASGYGTQLYHNTTFKDTMSLKNKFVYSSNEYENTTEAATELELPNFYVENVNEQNTENEPLKSLAANTISKEYINNIAFRQGSLLSRTPQQLLKFRNILFGSNYLSSRSISNVNEFPYYNAVEVYSEGESDTLSTLLKKVSFREEILAGLLSETQGLEVRFNVNETEISVEVKDILNVLQNGSLQLDLEDKVFLGTQKKNSNFMINNFKKSLILGALYANLLKDMPSFADMISGIEAKRETIAYKVDKFIDNDSQPTQTFWLYGGDRYHDYQIKRSKTYRYKLSCYCLIYGTETRVLEASRGTGGVELTISSSPSYKYALLDFDESTIKVAPKMPMPPHVQFYNENNSDNIVKIYLSLAKGSMKRQFIPITEEDMETIGNIEPLDGMYDFDYELQDGKFEVYRLSKRPESYLEFDGAKILDVRNNISTTDVIFKENISPNKKYYFMFRSINFIGIPSNPSPVYEVELIKMASTSKIVASVVSMEEDAAFIDKTFKNLVQIKPAFQQEVFDDQDEFVQDLNTFNKNINDLTLGTASDKVWGKKFKIRVKSKDTGKIIDLNVKFNLIKDNIN